jgi:sugar lactone lactonase YvrE
VVTTLAGSNIQSWVDGTGSQAAFSNPFRVVSDGNGSLYVTDHSNSRIRRVVISTGVVTTLAGSGNHSFADGTGTLASFNFPIGIAMDSTGNIFIGDRDNHRIRRIVVSTGQVTTLAGSGNASFADGIGTQASFAFPHGLALDGSGNLFVADRGNHRIRRIVTSTGRVTTLAGSGSAGFIEGIGTVASFSSPQGVAVDGRGNLFVADTDNHRIRRIYIQSTPCQAGSYCSDGRSLKCPINSFSSIGQPKCSSCPTGSSCPLTGQPSISSCLCPER